VGIPQLIAYMPDLEPAEACAALRRAGLGDARLLGAGSSLADALAAAADARATLVLASLRDGAGSVAQLAGLLAWLAACGAALRVLDVGLDSAANSCSDVAALVAELGAAESHGGPGGRPRGRPGIAAGDPRLGERILELRASGASLRAIADALNAEGVPTPRGGASWRPSSVQSALGYRRPRPLHPQLPPLPGPAGRVEHPPRPGGPGPRARARKPPAGREQRHGPR
jgi:hypothetical protein